MTTEAVPTDPIVRSYDPKQVYILINGIPGVGYADGNFCVISAPEDFWESKRGADGTVERIARNVFDVEVVLRFKSSSLTSNYLTELHALDKKTGKGIFILSVINLNQAVPLLVASQAWVTKAPPTELGDAPGVSEWNIKTGPANYTPGGLVI